MIASSVNMYTFKTSHKHLKQARQMRSRRGTYFVTGLLALTVFWTLYTVRRVILKNKPLPSQMRSRLQSQEISEHLATSKTDPCCMWQSTGCRLFASQHSVMKPSVAYWDTESHHSCMAVTGAVDFHPGKIWIDTDGDLVQVSNCVS